MSPRYLPLSPAQRRLWSCSPPNSPPCTARSRRDGPPDVEPLPASRRCWTREEAYLRAKDSGPVEVTAPPWTGAPAPLDLDHRLLGRAAVEARRAGAGADTWAWQRALPKGELKTAEWLSPVAEERLLRP
ncbi:hypothetical protein [Streptomyces sp. NPDC058579]|uniref:hypothetical protein n=1 Tax=Streptomyces sp. NPDC058579 TaxID=3346548 RepID=UPI00364B7BEE